MAENKPADVWAAGAAYEPYVGRWSRLVAREFLHWLALPEGMAWLDVGCGTGALSRSILDECAPRSVHAVNSSAGFLAYAQQHVDDPLVTFELGDAQALPLHDHSVDAAVSGLVLNFVPDKTRMVAEMRRVARPGGTAALYVWDYAGKMALIRHFWDAARAIDPQVTSLDEGRRFPICRPEALLELFVKAGFAEIESRTIDVPTVFRDFADYWTPFLAAKAPLPATA